MKKILLMGLIATLGFLYFSKDNKPIDLSVSAKAMILIEAESGKVLYEENSKEALPIASMSKLMTQYLVLDAIREGRIAWADTYEPSEYVQGFIGQGAFVKLGMRAGSSYTIEELFKAMTVNSANDAAIALAEVVSGTEEDFADLMNAQAKIFKLKETTFYNASGLDGGYLGQGAEKTNRSSARDVSVIIQKLLSDHPEVIDYSGLTSFEASSGERFWSTNLMLPGMPQAFPGIDGLKTGYTDEAGACFASTGVFGDKRLITVVIDVEADGKDEINPRFILTKELIEHFSGTE